MRFILTGGQVHDATQAIPLLTGVKATYVIGDKGYDSDRIVDFIQQQEAVAVIDLPQGRARSRIGGVSIAPGLQSTRRAGAVPREKGNNLSNRHRTMTYVGA